MDRVNFIDGSWYVAVSCPKHGLIEEQVSTDDAKTARGALDKGIGRHLLCQHELCAELQKQARKDEIVAAEFEVKRAETLLARAEKALAEALALSEENKLRGRLVEQARVRVEQCKPGPDHARSHLEYVRKTNEE